MGDRGQRNRIEKKPLSISKKIRFMRTESVQEEGGRKEREREREIS